MDYIPVNKSDNPNDIKKSHNEGCIAQMSAEGVCATLENLEGIWNLDETGPDAAMKFMDEKTIVKLMGVHDIECIDNERINVTLGPILDTLTQLHNHVTTKKMFDDDPGDTGVGIGMRINRSINILKSWELVLKNFKIMNEFLKCAHTGENKFDPTNILAPSAYVYSPETLEENNDYQHCIFYTLQILKQENYKRYKGWVCKQISHTKAWEKHMTIEDYIETIFQKEINIQMWRRFTKTGANRKNLVEHIRCCVDPMFPELKKNRHVFSFSDGIFIAKDDSKDGWFHFYPYTDPAFNKLPANLVSAKYFDIPFGKQEYDTWKDIDTPTLDTILDYQKFDEDVKRWMYIFIGRMVFDVNELDKWQVVPFLKGMASTGKGKLCEICAHFYEGEDVGQMSDLPEKNFALSAIFNKFLFVAPEITNRFGLGQAEFQSMVSGELVSVAQKFKTAQAVEWKTPGMFAGNEPPGYRDNSGSIQRRMVIFPFPEQVQPEDMDMELPQKLKAESAKILYKCVWAYQEAAATYKKAGIWSVLPKMILDAKEEMALSTNSLRHFLASEHVEYGQDLAVPMSEFQLKFNEHTRANNLGRPRWGPDFYNGPLASKRLKIVIKTEEYKGRVFKGPWIKGVNLVDDLDTTIFSNDK